tara:strand:+ start:925 stop:1350 length:426 start_codon:yes stop_codon:yes gene_type:complete
MNKEDMAYGLVYIGVFFWLMYLLFFAEGYDEFEWYYYFFGLVIYPALGIYSFRLYIIDFFKSNRDNISFKFNKRKKVMKNKSRKSLFESSFFQYLKANPIVLAVVILVAAFFLWKLITIFSCTTSYGVSFSECILILQNMG